MKSSFGAYKRVCMIGIDGMGAFNQKTATPVMDELFKNGATTYTALSSRPTISGECWTSMLTGAIPAVHGLSNACMHPIDGLPTIFGILRAAMPDAESAAFTDWSPIANQIISPVGGASHLDTGADDALTDRICAYLDEKDPTLLFIQFDSVDGAGHTHGYGFPGHLERITHVDGLVGKILDKYKEHGYFDDTLFIITADHGGTPQRGHGGWSVAEREVFLGVAGKTVQHGTIGTVSLRDFPAIVLWALGVKAPEFNPKGYASQMPVGVFADCGIADRVDLFADAEGYESKPEPAFGSPEYIDNFIPREKVLMRLSFDNDLEDVTGKCLIEPVRGFVKLYSTGVRGMCGEFGNGVLKVTGLPTPPVFTISLWHILPAGGCGWIDLLSTRDDVHRSITVAAVDEGVGIYLKEPNQDQTYRYIVGEMSEDFGPAKWCNYMFTVNTLNNTITTYYNFGEPKVIQVDGPIADYFDLSRLYLGLEQSAGTVLKMVDDVMILQGEPDINAFRNYYKK